MSRATRITPPATTIVPAQSTEERNYERCLAAIAGRRQRLIELESELRGVREALIRFEAVCHARVGDLLDQLRDVAIAIAKYERRLDPAMPLDEPDLPLDEDGFDGRAEPFASNHQHVPGERERRPGRRLLASEEAEAKRIYKDLARRCHPDLATSDADRRRREAMMQSINEAYRARDIAELRSLYVQAEAVDPTFGDRPLQVRLAWARAELIRLNAMVEAVNDELATLRGMEVHRLWRRYVAGDPVLDHLEDQLEDKLAAQGRRLDLTIVAFRRLQAEQRREAPAPAG
ncbi:MAG: J domain-containing protein [Chloroflexota bacterium]|nr:J domain-containing protein [Chloroflexota bacterium]